MRITFNTKFNQGLDGILNTQQRLLRAQDQLIKQTKILTPADDPSGSAKVLGVGQNLSQLSQYEQNSIAVKNNLGVEETVLTSVRTAMDRARVLALASGNGSYSQSEREAVAAEIEGIQQQLFDLMNSRNVEGGYLFSGFQDSVPAFSVDSSTGKYVFNGDDGSKALQVSPGVSLSVNDSGKKVFDSVQVRPEPTAPVIAVPGPVSASINVVNQTIFNNFYVNNYDKITPANNTFNVELTAPSNFQITRGGVPLAPPVTGAYTSGQPISFNGLEIVVNGPAGAGRIDFDLPAPQKTNILNTLNELMAALRTPGPVDAAFQRSVSKAVGEIDAASTSVASTRSAIGGRINVMDSINGSNADLKILATQYQADIAEVDFSKVIADLTKEETALKAVQQTFSSISNTSLFDFIR
jgi:flagellar hook-associated protein 3 FlgL